MKRDAVTKGSWNIFRDLGFSEERSTELILKNSLSQALQDTVRGQGWKQVEAAACQEITWSGSAAGSASFNSETTIVGIGGTAGLQGFQAPYGFLIESGEN